MWKKRMASVVVIIVLVGTALGIPLVTNYYNDKSIINKIQYVKSEDINILSDSDKEDIAVKLKQLDEQSTHSNSVSLELNFNPSDEKLEEIYDNIESEMSKWLDEDIMGLEQSGICVSKLSDFAIVDVVLYSFDKISFFQVVAVSKDDVDTSMRIAIDSDCYKIYSVETYGGLASEIINIYEKYNLEKGIDVYELGAVVDGIAYKVGEYYDIDPPELEKKSEDLISYAILSNLNWRIKLFNDENSPTISIGIPEF